MRKAFLISIAIMAITMVVTVIAAAFCQNAMAIGVYALACVAATVMSGIIAAVNIELFTFYSYSWLFYMGGHLLTTVLLLVSEWEPTEIRMDSETIPTIAVPFLLSAIFYILAEKKEKEQNSSKTGH